eukprot:c52252_g1_i1 orf=21-230(+)
MQFSKVVKQDVQTSVYATGSAFKHEACNSKSKQWTLLEYCLSHFFKVQDFIYLIDMHASLEVRMSVILQ